jgi:teichuronic acid exporter
MGAHALGIYTIAYQLVVVPQVRLNPVLTRVAFPIFALRQGDNAVIRRGFLELTRLISMVTFPLMMGLAVTAPHLVPAIFGAKWEPSVPIIQIEAILGALFALGNPTGAIYLAKDRPDIGFKVNLARLVGVAGALYLAVHESLLAVAWAYVGVSAVLFVVTRLVLERLIGLSWRDYLFTLLRPALMTLVMGLAVLLVTIPLEEVLDDARALFALQVLAGAATYAALVLTLDRSYARSIWALLSARRAKPAPT